MLLLALSCLQGRPMRAAFDELAALADGVQLTPGNHPTPEFSAHVAKRNTRTHHGFVFTQRAARVWSKDQECLVASESVHPPQLDDTAAFLRKIEEGGARVPCLETMYPGYALGTGDELEWAMRLGLSLAIDVSHLYIQKELGVISDDTLRRLRDYDRVAEAHVSANDGRRDLHAPIDARTFGLDWVRELERRGLPVVLECYMHRLSTDARKLQIALLKE